MPNPRRLLPLAAVALLALAACRKPPDSLSGLLTARTMGLVHLERDELAEAETEFRTVIRLAPEEPLGYANLGVVWLRAGRLAEAEVQIRHALALDSADLAPALTLAAIQAARSDTAAARATLEVYRHERVCEHLHRVGTRLLHGLHRLQRAHPEVVTGVGGVAEMCFLHYAGDGASQEVAAGCARRGLVFKRTAYNFVSLAHDEATVDRTLEILEETVASVQ